MESLLLIIGIVVYLIISFLIGFWKTKGTNLAGFIASKYRFGFWAILLTLLASLVGGGMFFVIGQFGYEAGIVGYIFGLCYLLGFILMRFAIPKIRRLFKGKNYLTLIDLVDDQYKSKRTTIAFAAVNFLIFFFLLAG